MPRNGIRSGRPGTSALAAAPLGRAVVFLLPVCLGSALFLLAGCSSLQNKNRVVVKVETKRKTAQANRLTYAGIRALQHQHIDLAAEKFREAVAADYAYGPAHNNLGLLHYEQGNLYQAVLAFEKAREFLPNDPAVVYNLGLALESAGRTDEALELYYTANAMDRANPNYLGNLVRLRARLGERDDLLEQQLKDLVLIETRPQWRRWADTQLALTMNLALDRGPATPDLESAVGDASDPGRSQLQDKIIDLTPVATASLDEPVSDGRERELEDPGFEDLPDDPPPELLPPTELLPPETSPPEPTYESEFAPMLREDDLEDLTEGD